MEVGAAGPGRWSKRRRGRRNWVLGLGKCIAPGRGGPHLPSGTVMTALVGSCVPDEGHAPSRFSLTGPSKVFTARREVVTDRKTTRRGEICCGERRLSKSRVRMQSQPCSSHCPVVRRKRWEEIWTQDGRGPCGSACGLVSSPKLSVYSSLSPWHDIRHGIGA